MPLMSVAVENRNYTSVVANGSNTTLCYYWSFIIGSGDVNKIVFSDIGWYHNTSASTVDIPNSLTIVKAHIDNGVIAVPVTYLGSRTWTISPGDNDQRKDDILPSHFGLSKFTVGDTYWFKVQVLLPAVGASIPFSERYTTHRAGQQAIHFDLANTTIVNGVDAVGPFTTSGVAPASRSQGYCPIMLGEYVNPAAVKVVFVEGNSIVQNVGDTTSPTIGGNGWFQRMLYNGGVNPLSGLNWSKSGAFSTTFNTSTNDRHAYWCQFANIGICETATNDFGTSGTLLTSAQMQARQADKIIKMRVYGIKTVIATLLLPRTTSASNNWISDIDQTVSGAGWGAGGNVELYNTWISASAAIDKIIRFDSSRSVTNQYLWDSNGSNKWKTTDGTHPSTLMHQLMAADSRGAIDSIILLLIIGHGGGKINNNIGIGMGL